MEIYDAYMRNWINESYFCVANMRRRATPYIAGVRWLGDDLSDSTNNTTVIYPRFQRTANALQVLLTGVIPLQQVTGRFIVFMIIIHSGHILLHINTAQLSSKMVIWVKLQRTYKKTMYFYKLSMISP